MTVTLVLCPWGIGDRYSGPGTLAARLFAQPPEGHKVIIVAPFVNYVPDESVVKPGGLRLIRTPALPVQLRKLETVLWIIAAWLCLSTMRYDVVHLQGCYYPNLLAAIAARRPLVILPVLEGGDLRVRTGLRSRVKELLLRRAVARSVGIFGLTPTILDEARDLGIGRPDYRLIRNPVTPNFYRSSRHLPQRTPVVGLVGRLGPSKRPHLLLEAVKLLRATGKKIDVLLVGPFESDEYRSWFLSTHPEGEGWRHLDFSRRVDEILKSDLDLFVLPSASEGSPGALAEALVSALPVIVSAVGNMRDMVQESRAGVALEDPSPHQLAEAIAWALDSDRYSQLSENAGVFGRQLMVDAVAHDYFEAIGSWVRK